MILSQDKAAKWEGWLGIFLAIGFPALMLKLDASGIDTGEAFVKVLGLIMIASVCIGFIALVVAVLGRIGAFLFGK